MQVVSRPAPFPSGIFTFAAAIIVMGCSAAVIAKHSANKIAVAHLVLVSPFRAHNPPLLTFSHHIQSLITAVFLAPILFCISIYELMELHERSNGNLTRPYRDLGRLKDICLFITHSLMLCIWLSLLVTLVAAPGLRRETGEAGSVIELPLSTGPFLGICIMDSMLL